MKHILLFLFLTLFVSVESQKYHNHLLFVKFKNSESALSEDFVKIQRQYQFKKTIQFFQLKELNTIYLVELNLRKHSNTEQIVKELEKLSSIEYAEKVPNHKLFAAPNDPQYPSQWGLAKIQADLAWNIHQGNSTCVKVAVTDDGFLMNHQDLTNKWYINTSEFPANGIDDDANGYIDDWRGWDAGNNDNDPSAYLPSNTNNTHGTHVAGIVSAETNNAQGIASIGYNIKMIPVKIASDPSNMLLGAIKGVEYAIAAHADVINMSWGGGGSSITEQLVFDLAYSQDIICVAAAGNSSSAGWMYPASYNHVISVAATSSNDALTWFSNYGSKIDVAAPGENILSCKAGATNSYGNFDGTSMASPLVAGLCGLMKCYNPMPADSIEACLKRTCDNINAQNPTMIGNFGAGRINAFQALLCLATKPMSKFINDTLQCANIPVSYIATSVGAPSMTYKWSFPGGNPTTSTQSNPLVIYNTNGWKSATLITTNGFGSDTITISNTVRIGDPKASLIGRKYTSYNTNAVILVVKFSGNPPFDVTLTDGTNNYTQSNITSNPYYFSLVPQKDTSEISILSYTDKQCSGVGSGKDTIYKITTSSGGTSYCESSFNYTGATNDVIKIDKFNGANWRDLYSTNGFTWECWFNLGNRTSASISSIESLMSASDAIIAEDIGLHFNWPNPGSGKINFVVSGQPSSSPWGVASSNMSFAANTWYHVAGVCDYNNNKIKLYVNGIQIATTNLSLPLSQRMQNNVAATIGNQDLHNNPFGGAKSPFNGKIDEVRFWNVARTSAEIQSAYKSCLPSSTPNLVAYFKGDENTGTTTVSKINGNFVGSLQNAVGWEAQVDSVNNCTICTNTSDCDTTNLNTGLVLNLPFNGNTNDISGNSNHATNYGATLVTDRKGNANGAYQFNGSSSRMVVPNFPTSNSNNISVSLWFKSNVASQDAFAGVIDHSHTVSASAFQNWVIEHNNTSSAVFLGWRMNSSTWSNMAFVSAPYDYTKWNHLVAIKSGDTLIYYLNCVKISTNVEVNSSNIIKQIANLNIGFVMGSSPIRFYNGAMDDIRIYHRVLGEKEVKALGECCTTSSASDCDTTNLNTGLVLNLPFNGNTNDISGLGNHATNFGATPVAGKAGIPNTAYRFDSTNFMSVAHNASLNLRSFSITAILKPLKFNTDVCYANQVINKGTASTGAQWAMQYAPTTSTTCFNRDTNNCNMIICGSVCPPSNSVTNTLPYMRYDGWECSVLTYDSISKEVKMYMNGILRHQWTATFSSLYSQNTADLFIGKYNDPTYPGYLQGVVDDLRVYNRALAPSEVKGYCGTCVVAQNPSSPKKCDSAKKFTNTKCPNETLSLTSGHGIKYQWSSINGLSNDTIQNPLCTVQNDETYLVLRTDTNGCQLVDTVEVLVNKGKFYSPLSDQLICQGDSAQVTIPFYATNISWTPNTKISNPTIKNPFLFPTTTTRYYLQFRDTFGCLHYDTIDIIVKSCCAARARFKLSDSLLCFGSKPTITNTSKGTITSYKWDFGSAIPATATTANPPLINYPIGNTYTIQLIVSNGICQDTMTKNLNIVQFKPRAGRDTSSCLASYSIQLGSSALSDWNYTWTPATYLDNSKIADPISTILNDSISYILVAEDKMSKCKFSDTVIVKTNRKIDSTVTSNRICDKDSILFNGIQYKKSGRYFYTMKTKNLLCDSLLFIKYLDVVVKDSFRYNPSIHCEFFIDNKGIKHTNSYLQIDTIKSVLGCDSFYFIHQRDIFKKIYKERDIKACNEVIYKGKKYTTSKKNIDSTTTLGPYSGCDSIITHIHSVILPKPIATITASSPNPLKVKDTVTLTASGGTSYIWLHNQSINPILKYKAKTAEVIYYKVRVTDTNLCTDTTSYKIISEFDTECIYGIPNAFTPNGDLFNDIFIPNMAICADIQRFSIFDRWGEKVFETDQNIGWDGTYKNKPALAGIYVYYIEFNTSIGIRIHKGSVTLVR